MQKLSRTVGERLKAAGAMLVTAESCTGGWVAQALTSVAGSSEWFERGFVTYSDDAKRELLGVRAETLSQHGAVSEETAREMARGALERSRGTLALAVTGVAGPGGGSAEKPVGMVFRLGGKGRRAAQRDLQPPRRPRERAPPVGDPCFAGSAGSS
jgi:nicotinamide-nucleotide amidase